MTRFSRVAVMGTGTMGPGMGAVLARAVRWHCQDRVIRVGNRTVIF